MLGIAAAIGGVDGVVVRAASAAFVSTPAVSCCYGVVFINAVIDDVI